MAEQVPTVAVGETVKATVEHLAPYGAFVRLENGQKAMIHISEISHNFVKDIEEVLQVGQEITAKVVKIDEKKRIDLSIKALQVREQRPRRHEEEFEKKLANFIKFSDEKFADINTKSKAPHGTRRRTGHSTGRSACGK